MKSFKKIKENRVFCRAYRKAESHVTPHMVVYIMRNNSLGTRLGITAGKKLGNAVKRNRAKRIITAAFRECFPFMSGNHDYIIVARTRILSVKSTTLTTELINILSSAGIYNGSAHDE